MAKKKRLREAYCLRCGIDYLVNQGGEVCPKCKRPLTRKGKVPKRSVRTLPGGAPGLRSQRRKRP